MAARRIPLFKVHMPSDVDDPVREVLHSGDISNGPNVARFEEQLQAYIGNPRLAVTADISASLVMALRMAGVGPEDEVLACPMSCLATTLPVLNLFARIVWCDLDPETGGIDPVDVERRITPRSKAILVYHWAGNPVNLDAIYGIASRHSLRVVEDAGEAMGGEFRGRKLGNTGSDFTVFSFQAIRHITTGEGAAVAFGKPGDYERGRWMKRYGIHQPSFRDSLGEINPQSDVKEAGYNNQMNHIAATIGLMQCRHLPDVVRRHQDNGRYFDAALAGCQGIQTLKRGPEAVSAYWVYSFYAERRDELLRHLRDQGIMASKVHLRNDYYSCFGPVAKDLPGVDHFSAHQVSIPCGWWVTPDDRDYMTTCIRSGW